MIAICVSYLACTLTPECPWEPSDENLKEFIANLEGRRAQMPTRMGEGYKADLTADVASAAKK